MFEHFQKWVQLIWLGPVVIACYSAIFPLSVSKKKKLAQVESIYSVN